MDAILLLGLGFVVGLSGALLPGPLLIYTINESLERGKWTGAKVILGHAIVELFVFLLLIFGLLQAINSDSMVRAISLLGGMALIGMGLASIKDLRKEYDPGRVKSRYGVVLGGIVFTALNPGFPLWWATAGLRLLLEGYELMGSSGMVLVLLGHWGADLGWYLFVSLTASKSSGGLFRLGWYRYVRAGLSGLLLVIGLYFLSTAL